MRYTAILDGEERIVEVTAREAVAASVELALTMRDRRRGLLGRQSLDADAAMLLSPCKGVHTVGMPFAIDVVFVATQHGTYRTCR